MSAVSHDLMADSVAANRRHPWTVCSGNFDPGLGTFNFMSAGGLAAFVSKLDSAGNFVWAKQLSGALSSTALAVAVDASGDVYTVGLFEGALSSSCRSA